MRVLPKRVCEKGGKLYFRRKRAGHETYVRLPPLESPAFHDALAMAEAKYVKRPKSLSPLGFAMMKQWKRQNRVWSQAASLPTGYLRAAREARKRAAKKGLPFELGLDELAVLWQRAQGACEISNIPFDFGNHGHKWPPFAPSLDRLNNKNGYTYENVRLVCVCVNAALNQWGDDVFWSMVLTASENVPGGILAYAKGERFFGDV